jgi:pimeloyl-ACP methyl ester carboxylesterase
MQKMSSLPTRSIVFITGTFFSHSCWEEWSNYFEMEGYTCIAPAWPYKYAPAEELRNKHQHDPIVLNTINSLTDHFAGIVNMLPEKPILIGHSLGGLIVQLLLQRDLGIAGIALHSFPPNGVTRLRFSFLRSMWATMMLFTSEYNTYLMSFAKWNKSIANGLSCEQQKESYYKYAIPESKKIIKETFKCLSKIDFEKAHVPLLFTSGSIDKLIPASLNYSNYKRYKPGNSVTDYKEFSGQSHLVFGPIRWRLEADFVLYWLQGINN